MRTRRSVALAAALGMVLVTAAGCSDNETGESGTTTTAVGVSGSADLAIEGGPDCEVLDQANCLFPFPSDRFTRDDATSPTGLRVDFPLQATPANTSGVHIDPTEWNRSDGFSPGAALILYVPDIDLSASGAAPVTDIERSLDDESPIVIVDTETGQRHPHWAELDANAPPGEGALLIRPAVNFREGHRYVVALRDLRRTDGTSIEASPVFAAFRDRLGTDAEAVEDRRESMEEVFSSLAEADVERNDLYLAWDFTVASAEGLTGRLVAMRDAAFDVLGDDAPRFSVTFAEDNPDQSASGWNRVVKGTVEVPSFLTGRGDPGTVLNNGDAVDGIPEQNGVLDVPFTCVLPRSEGGTPMLSALYGHGLLGSQAEGETVGKALATPLGAAVCSTDWIGMSSSDLNAIIDMIKDMSAFRMMPDRLQQSMVNFLFLGRALIHDDGFADDEAFQIEGTPMVGEELTFVGNSQGGILGGALSAVATDWERVFLGVPAMNYSTLLQRSIDFDRFAPLMEEPYPDPLDYQVVLGMVQMLWDRGENNGYAWHVTADPLPGASPKQVFAFVAFGDHQVPNVATDVMARTMGLSLRAPGLASGRSTDADPFWGIDTIGALPFRGSGYVMWDFATPAPPTQNLPNREGDDPHGKGSADARVVEMVIRFLRTGEIVDVCDAGPCQSPG